jgi:hypothetical protein
MPSKRSKSKEREKKRKSHQKMSVARAEFEKIDEKHKMRKKRKTRSGKEHLMQNLKAKKGMQMLETEGRIVQFSRRWGKAIGNKRLGELFKKKQGV